MTRACLLLVLLLPACHRGQDTAGIADAMASASPVEAAAPAPAVLPARCHPAGSGVAIASPEELELGDEVALDDGYAVSLVHRTPAGRMMGVALVDRDVTAARVVDLAVTLGDASPPHLLRRGKELLVAGQAVTKSGSTRELAVLALDASGAARPLATIPQQRDDSLAFDLGAGLVVWDEATAGLAPRGVIRVAELGGDHGGAPHDVSPPESDAEMPRLAADGAGAFVLWVARRPEPAVALDAGLPAAAEAVGEARTNSWLEGVTVDAAGIPSGPVRRLTPASGHVSAYDVQALAGPGRPSLLVVARDDGEAVDGSGGSLLRVRLREDGVDPPLGLPGDGLGRGAPSLVDGPLPWLAWIGPHEELRLLPLDAAGGPVGPPSAEPLLDDALPLAMLGGTRLLAAFPGDAVAPLRLFTCDR
jgi:hypothetical protein